MQEVTARGIRGLAKRRLKAANEFYLTLEQIKKDEDVFDSELRKRAPRAWRRCLEDINFIGGVFLLGHSDGMILLERYGFKDKADVARKAIALNEAWEGIVRVTVSFGGEPTEKFWAKFTLCE